MTTQDFTPVSRVASDYDHIPPITDGQRRAWLREIDAQFEGGERDEMVALILGGDY